MARPKTSIASISSAATAKSAKDKDTKDTKTSTTTGRKRKLDDKNMQKYYAVRAGQRPGIYLTWHECQAQIAGFKGAQFKSFTSRDDAAAFVAGKNPDGGAKDKGEPRFYAVVVGNKSGIYTDWASASQAIVGAKGPKYKKFPTQAEAANFIRMYASAATRQALSGTLKAESKVKAAEKAKEEDDEDEEEDEDDDEDEDVEDDEDEEEDTLQPAKQSRTSRSNAVLNIYTDGSSLGNGKAGSSAGIGVYFGPDDKRNISERLVGDPQTNQRAELMAILRALQTVPTTQPVRILSDSMYSINCVSEWYKSWSTNGWKTRTGDAVMNQDIIRAVRTCIDSRDKVGTATVFQWVKGHSSHPGNEAADQLANQGARLRK